MIASWSSYYGNHQLVAVTVRYVHLASTLVGGGSAVVLDGKVLQAARADGATRLSVLRELRGSHRLIVPAFTLVALSGLLLTAADVDTFLASKLYWTKLGFVTLLVVNGALLLAAESAAERTAGERWGRMAAVALASLTLWMATLFVGTWLTVGA
ncbi:MAG: hypothetical protein ABI880_10600 [Acidobacteriota bacterium]